MDTQFNLTKQSMMNGYDAQAARRAVYGFTSDPVQAAKDRQRFWRLRVVALARAGWAAAEDKNLQYLRNCPPVGFTYRGSIMHCCDRARVCPMCYGRSVQKIYQHLDRALYGGHTGKELLLTGKLLSVRREWIVEDWKVRFDKLLRDMSKMRRNERNRLCRESPAGVTAVIPEPRGDNLRFRRVTIMLVPTSWKKDMPEGWDWTLSSNLDRKNLVRIVSTALKYPRGMLHGSAEDARFILDGCRRKRLRMFSGFGDAHKACRKGT